MDLAQLAKVTANVTLATPTTRSHGVRPSRELERILAIPRRLEDTSRLADLDRLVKLAWGTMPLWPLQAQALWEARAARGLFAPIAVGGGKTLIACLLPTVLDIPEAVILTTAGLVAQAKKMLAEYRRHFKIHQNVKWLSYGVLSNANHCTILDRLRPKLIIADECHLLSNPTAARTKRFVRYFRDNPGTIFCGLTGTVTKSSIKDFAHLQALALGDRSTLPRDYPTLTEWAEAIDVSANQRPVGALLQLCTPEERLKMDPTSAVRFGVRRRMTQTLGVVASSTNDVPGVALKIDVIPTPASPLIKAAHKALEDTWERPDGEVLTYALEFDRVSKQIRLGGFYRWVWPEGKPDTEWVLARRAYRSEMRTWLGQNSRAGMDSPFLVENAIRRGEVQFEFWRAWKDVSDRPEPPVRWRWISDRVVRWAAAWVLASSEPSIVWTNVVVVGRMIARLAGLRYYGAGNEDARDILAADGSKHIVASIPAHGQGRNLQPFRRNLVLAGLSTGKTYEQLIGRTHRPGQLASEVQIDVPSIFEPELDKALERAEYTEQTIGNSQKLLSVKIGIKQ